MGEDEAIPRATVVVPPIVQVHFDGACEPPKGGGVATYGFTVEGNGLDHEEFGLAVKPWSRHATNNVAEYVAAIRALEYLRSRQFRGPVLLFGDSQLVVRQMAGEYEVKAEHLRAYHARLTDLASQFEETRFHWIPREENVRADELSKAALRAEGPRLRRRPADAEVAEPDEPDVP
jgi:ribonuclease HI